MVGEHRLVQLRQGDHGGVHRSPVQTAPFAVERPVCDLVADDDVGVQVGVAGAGVEVIERRRHQPGDIDLRNGTVAGGCARPGGCNLTLHERNHLRNRRMMRLTDQGLGPGVGDRPQCRGRLRDREGEVEPGHRATLPTLGLLSLNSRDRLTFRARTQRWVEIGDPGLDPLRDRLVGGEREAERVAGDRITTHPHHELELGLRNPVPDRELALAE